RRKRFALVTGRHVHALTALGLGLLFFFARSTLARFHLFGGGKSECRRGATAGIAAPAAHVAVGRHAAGVRLARRDLHKLGARRRRALTVAVFAPALCLLILLADRAAVVAAGRDLREQAVLQGALLLRVVAPASHVAVGRDCAGMIAAGRDLLVRSFGRIDPP